MYYLVLSTIICIGNALILGRLAENVHTHMHETTQPYAGKIRIG